MTDTRMVDALNGGSSPSGTRGIWRAMSEADSFCREVAEAESLREENAGLRLRLEELRAEVDEKDAEIRRLNRKQVGW